MSFSKMGLCLASVIGAIMTSGAAKAQSVSAAQDQSVDLFARDRGVAVMDRPRPAFDALGIRAGSFMVFPRAQFDLEHNDNVLASKTNEVSDWIVRVRPEVGARSNWSRHELRGVARLSANRNFDLKSERTTDWFLGSSGRIDIVRGSKIDMGADFSRITEPRTSSNTAVAAAKQVQYNLGQAFVSGTRSVGRLKIGARVDLKSFNFDDSETTAGAPIDQDARDRDVYSASGRVDYALSPATAVFAQVTGNNRSYPSAAGGLARDSSGYEALAGVNFELGAVSRGEVAVGYLRQEYDQAAYQDIDGFGARAEIQWMPTQLTTIGASASRTVEDAGIVGSGGYLSTAGALKADHELLRNLILSGQLRYSQDEYNGIDRKDDRVTASVGGTYLLRRNLGFTVTAVRLKQSSEGAVSGPEYAVNRLVFSILTQF